MFGAVDADVLTNAWMSGRRIAGPNGVAKRVVSYAVPMVRIHLPPAASPLRTRPCSAVPVVRLTEVFRQAGESRIIVNAHRINQGLMPDLSRLRKAAISTSSTRRMPKRA